MGGTLNLSFESLLHAFLNIITCGLYEKYLESKKPEQFKGNFNLKPNSDPNSKSQSN